MLAKRKSVALSLTILREETSVVKIAEAIKTPQAGFRRNCSEIAKTGIKLSFVSDKTIVWSINSIPNINTQIIIQLAKISLYERFSPSFEMITPPSKTSRPLYKIGFEIENARVDVGVGSFAKISVIHTTIIGTKTTFSKRIFSMPSTTIIPPRIVIASPNARGTDVSEYMMKSPPASIEQRDMHAARKMAKRISLPLGISPFWPAMRKSAQRRAEKTEDSATLRGDDAPKNTFSSRPDEKPAPIAVPIYSAAVLIDFFTVKYIWVKFDICKSMSF